MLAPISMSDASMLSAEKRPASGWPTPAAVTPAIFMRTGGCDADSVAISAILSVRLRRSNDTLPWLALPPPARICSNAVSDFARDPVLRIKLEAEEAAHRDHDRGGQAQSVSLPLVVLRIADIAGGKFAILSVKGMR